MEELLKIHKCKDLKELAVKIVEIVEESSNFYDAAEYVEEILNGEIPKIRDE